MKPSVTWLLLVGTPALLAGLSPADGQAAAADNAPVRADPAVEPGSIIAGYVSPPAYTVSRYDEDYRFLDNPANRTEALDAIKYLLLFGRGPGYFLTLGGDLREHYEYIQNDNFGLGGKNPHGYWLQRLMLHGDWHWGPYVRAFAQLKSNLEEGRDPGPRSVDRKRLRHTTVSVSYYHFYRGGFFSQNQPGSKDVDYFSAWLTYKF